MARSRSFLLAVATAGVTAACVSTDASVATAPPAPPPAAPAPGAPQPAPLVVTPAPPPAPATPPPPGPRGPATSPTPGAPVSPPPQGPSRSWPPPLHPEGAIHIPCTLHAEIVPTVRRDEVELRFVLVNDAPDPVTVTLRGTCPGGVVELRGLPSTFDPMHRCQAGACASPTATATFTVPARKSVTIGGTTLRAKGDACNPPLPLGSTFVSAAIATDLVGACGGSAIHIVRDPKTGALRRAAADEPRVPATPPTEKPAPPPKPAPTQKPAPKQKPAPPTPRKQCPVCAFACPNGIPSRKVGPDGCPTCACEKLLDAPD